MRTEATLTLSLGGVSNQKPLGAGLQNLIPINSLAQETVKAWVDNGGVVDSVPDLNVVAAIARLWWHMLITGSSCVMNRLFIHTLHSLIPFVLEYSF